MILTNKGNNMDKITNIFQTVLASAARAREIRELRAANIMSGRYELGQYKKHPTPAHQATDEIISGVIGMDYLLKAVNKTNKRNREYNKNNHR
jgi:DNA-directed RNA polymerase subunit K/omega